MGRHLKSNASSKFNEAARELEAPGALDPLVLYLEYVMEEVQSRNPLSAYLLAMTVKSLRDERRQMPELPH